MDIVLIADGIHTLADIVIVDPTHADLVSQATFSQGMVVTIVAQANIMSYCNRHPKDDFIPLTIKIFGCLHQLGERLLSSMCQYDMVNKGL
jgi:hypothetical protein